MKSKTKPQTDTDDLFATTEGTEYTEKKNKSVIISENSPSKTKSNDNSVCSVNSVVKKSSGIPWLGDIPEHWELKKLKYPLHLLTQKTDRRENPLALENIESWTGKYISTESEFDGEGIDFESGDIIFGKLRPYLAKVYLASSSGEAVGDFFVMHPGKECFAKYATYLMLSRDFIDIIDGSTFGSKMPRASWEFMGNLKIPIPPVPEQKAIAEYLDRKTGRIDSLISKKEKLAELLKEKRGALISSAVTGKLTITNYELEITNDKSNNSKLGVDKKNRNSQFVISNSSRMKPSGINWLGEVPEHWEVKKIRYIFSFCSGGTPSTEVLDFWDGEIPWVSSKDMKFFYIEDSEDHITENAVSASATNVIQANTLLVVMRSGILQHSIPACVIKHDMAINQDIKAFIPKIPLSSTYYARFIEGHQKQLLTEWRKEGATVESLDMELIKNLEIPFPPYSEQKAIAEYLDRETGKIDSLISRVESAIGKLKEYRSAVISAAVTGKIATTEHTEYTEG